MSEIGPQIENQPNTGGHPDGDTENDKQRPRWLFGLLIATSLLVIMAVVIAWLGALVGITL